VSAAITVAPIDTKNIFSNCHPYADVPAWMSGFLYHVLNPRQVSMYLYLTMLAGETGVCHPTTKQIRNDLRLSSLSIVFGAIAVLEDYGFLLRERRQVPALRSRRNIYQRPTCEFTILRLLELGKIDGYLRPVSGAATEVSDDSRRLRDEWLHQTLGDSYAAYSAASDKTKTAVLTGLLRTIHEHRTQT
jgi:SOS-response transcriptional repressor LexA